MKSSGAFVSGPIVKNESRSERIDSTSASCDSVSVVNTIVRQPSWPIWLK